jgi:cell division protein FtsQ
VLLAGVALVALVAGAWVVALSSLLDVDHITVTGAEHTPAHDVRVASGIRTGDALLFLDAGRAEQRLEALPWVADARIERHLPGDVEIRIVERTPVAWARREADRVALIDARGRVLADVTAPPPGLPELAGLDALPPPGGTARPSSALGVPRALPPGLRTRVRLVQVRGADLALELGDGPEVRLGSRTHLETKARAALAVLEAQRGAPPAYVDVRVPSAPVTGERR